jgi:hypothetical protein
MRDHGGDRERLMVRRTLESTCSSIKKDMERKARISEDHCATVKG